MGCGKQGHYVGQSMRRNEENSPFPVKGQGSRVEPLIKSMVVFFKIPISSRESLQPGESLLENLELPCQLVQTIGRGAASTAWLGIRQLPVLLAVFMSF